MPFVEANGSPKIFPNSKGKKRRPGSLSLATVLRCRDNTFLDFITQCLQWDPEKRMTPSQGLKHEFITKLTKKVSSDNTASNTITSSTTNNNKTISTNSMFSTFEEFKNMSTNIKKSKIAVPNSSSIGLNKSKISMTSKADKTVSSLVHGDREAKTYSGIKHSTTQINNLGSNIARSTLMKSNTINAYNNGRKSSGSNLPKVTSTRNNDNHDIQLRKSTSNLVNYSDSNANASKVAKIIAAAEQKTLSSGKLYAKKDSSLAIETIKNVRRPSVKEIALAKENIDRANAMVTLKKSHSKEGVTSSTSSGTSSKKTNSLLDYKFPKTKIKHNLSINVNKLNVDSNNQSKSAYPKLSSGYFGSNNNDSNENGEKLRPRKYSILSKSLNSSLESVYDKNKPLSNETKTKDNDTEKLEFNKNDETNNNNNTSKVHVSSLKQPNVYTIKRPNSSGNMHNTAQRKSINNGSTTNVASSTSNINSINSAPSNNSKHSSSIPTSTVKLLPIINNTSNNSIISNNNSSFSSTISSSSSSTLVNDENNDTPVAQQSSIASKSLSLLNHDASVAKARPRTYSHSVYSSQGSSIPRLASIYKNSSNNIAKTINKINNNIESHNSSITKERDKDSIKTTGLVTKRKSAFSLKAKATQAAQSTQATSNTQPRWRI